MNWSSAFFLYSPTGALVDASVCTAFASQHFNSSGIIEVRLNSIRTAEVLIDGEILDFDELNSYQFPGNVQDIKYELSGSCVSCNRCIRFQVCPWCNSQQTNLQKGSLLYPLPR